MPDISKDGDITALSKEIQSLPVSVSQIFSQVDSQVQKRFINSDNYLLWLRNSLEISKASFRAWEATTEYFRATLEVLDNIDNQEELALWADGGKRLCSTSAPIAAAYFRSSHIFLTDHDMDDLNQWINAGESLYHGTWKSGALATKFFETSPSLLLEFSMEHLMQYVAILDNVAEHSSEMAEECLLLAGESFTLLEEESTEGYLTLLRSTVHNNWKYTKDTQRSAALALPRVARHERARYMDLAAKMADERGKRYLVFLNEGSKSLSEVTYDVHSKILDMFENLYSISPEAAVEFIHSCPELIRRVGSNDMHKWYEAGLAMLQQNDAAGLGFFKLESARGESLIDQISATIKLEDIAPILQMYARGLTGGDMQLRSVTELPESTLGWARGAKAATDGSNIFLPDEISSFPTKNENFSWFKVLCSHQTGHLEFMSFNFDFKREGNIFALRRLATESAKLDTDGGSPTAVLSEFERFFDLFPQRRLASDIYQALEDARIDYLTRQAYAGLRDPYRLVQGAATYGRRSPQNLPLREGLVELLIRMTLLEKEATIPVPRNLRSVVNNMAATLDKLMDKTALPEDTAEACLIIYKLLIKVPNTPPPADMDWDETQIGELSEEGTSEIQEADSASAGGQDMVPGSGTEDDVEYKPAEDVDYRGDFKPELVQTLANLRKGQQQTDEMTKSPPLTEEMIKQLLEKSAEIDLSSVVDGNIDDPSGLFISSLMSESIEGPDAEFKDESGPGGVGKEEVESEEELMEEPKTSLYSEWDFVALDYKPNWCRIHESVIAEGSIDFYQETVDKYAGLINEVRRQFEMMVPETYRKEKRLPDGEEFDLDSAIEYIVEKRAGTAPDEKIYWRRNKTQRDVAVIFLLDMSASTAEAIDEKELKALNDDDDDVPEDPKQYLYWLKSRREKANRSYRRIIDLEKESTVLLIRALETIGDTYGIYGFSGYGRDNVEFYSVKALEEPFSDKVQRRIDGINPLHATRMGPAIRHAAEKLDDIGAKTKVLFLISDGRPQDRGYSREGAEKEYAVQDTHMALLETKAKGIIPFLLTVDRAGHDYMKEMCGDLPYEVLADINLLPKRLPQLYSRLTL